MRFCYTSTMHFQTLLGGIAVSVSFAAYAPYFWAIYKGTTEPHAISWLIWSVLDAVAWIGQIRGGAGAGAWATACTSIACIAIFACSLRSIQTFKFPITDWLCLGGASAALLYLLFAKNPLLAIMLVTTIDTIAFIPTYRKAYRKPYSEAALTYGMCAGYYLLSILAVNTVSIITILFPLVLVITNGSFAYMLMWRRSTIYVLRRSTTSN